MDRAPVVRGMITRQRGAAEQIVWMVILLVVPAALRMLFDRGELALPFLTYWPGLLIAALILDAGYAAAFAIIAAFTAQRLFGGPWFVTISTARVASFLLFALSASLIVWMGSLLRRTVRALDQATLQQERFNEELRHRIRNVLAIIQALAASGPKANNPLDFFRQFTARLDSLALASDLLRIGTEAEGRLPELVVRTVAPFNAGQHISLRGQACVLPDDSCIPLIMALHELCTNAMKYGALSVDTGHVNVSWFIAGEGDTLYVLWKERGGPQVSLPTREGIGTRLLRPQPGLDAVDLNFERDGVWCEIMIKGARPLAA